MVLWLGGPRLALRGRGVVSAGARVELGLRVQKPERLDGMQAGGTAEGTDLYWGKPLVAKHATKESCCDADETNLRIESI